MRKPLLCLLAVTPLLVPALTGPATAAEGSGTSRGHSCQASDASDVAVDSARDVVAVTGDLSTAGNNFGCFTNVLVKAGDTITFEHDTTCGGGAPRVFVSFKDGGGENTHDAGQCVASTSGTPGTVSYVLTRTGKVRTFAFISDRDESTITYSKLTIAGNVMDF